MACAVLVRIAPQVISLGIHPGHFDRFDRLSALSDRVFHSALSGWVYMVRK
jgi:hypothetical protein